MRIEASRLFEAVEEPASGLVSYHLRQPSGWWLQSFYFTNPSLSADGRYLWCYAMQDPAERKQLAVADFERGDIRLIDGSRFGDASPMIDPDDGSAYWIGGEDRTTLLRRGPATDEQVEVIGRFPDELVAGRRVRRIATHLTRTADRRALAVDAEIGSEDWYAGLMPLDGGPFEPWGRFDVCYNHAQACPSDPDRMLIAQDFWDDPVSGERQPYTHRLWLLDRDGTHRPLYAEPTPRHGHEWWSPGGDAVWYVHYDHGVRRHDLATGAVDAHWSGRILHAHCGADERLLVGDTWDRDGDDSVMGVAAYDIRTGAEVTIASPARLPSSRGHLHPHPQVTTCGRWVAYTAFTADGRTSLALCATADIRARLADRAGHAVEV